MLCGMVGGVMLACATEPLCGVVGGVETTAYVHITVIHIRKLTHKMTHLVRFQKVQSFILNQLVLMRLAQLRPIAAILDTRLNVF